MLTGQLGGNKEIGGKAPQPPRVSLENRSLTIASKMGKNRSWALQELR